MKGYLTLLAYIGIGGLVGWFFPNICGMLPPSGKGIMFGDLYFVVKALAASFGLAAGAGVGIYLWSR
jgi:hypothetical protein